MLVEVKTIPPADNLTAPKALPVRRLPRPIRLSNPATHRKEMVRLAVKTHPRVKALVNALQVNSMKATHLVPPKALPSNLEVIFPKAILNLKLLRQATIPVPCFQAHKARMIRIPSIRKVRIQKTQLKLQVLQRLSLHP